MMLPFGELPRTVLCLGAHCDDIEIGCGGTLLRLARACPELRVHWVVFSSTPERGREARAAADRFLEGVAHADVRLEDFRNGYFPFVGAEIKDYFERLKDECQPDLVLTHYRHDRHQDHRTLSDLAWNSFRDHLVLEYEIPKYDGDMGQPNLFVPLTDAERTRKNDILMECFASQRGRPWFARETFDGLMRLRGMECNAPGGYAEAFHARKLVAPWGMSPG